MNTSNCNLTSLFANDVSVLSAWLCAAQVVFGEAYPKEGAFSKEQKIRFYSKIANFKKRVPSVFGRSWSEEQVKCVLIYSLLFTEDSDQSKNLGFSLYQFKRFKTWYNEKKFKSIGEAQQELTTLLRLRNEN